jgi:uncharacterized protein
METILNSVTLSLIAGYQKHLSKYKGFRCAHNVLHKHGSCSEWAVKTIETEGALSMISKIRKRFIECNEAAKELSSKKEEEKKDSDACAIAEASCCLFSSTW